MQLFSIQFCFVAISLWLLQYLSLSFLNSIGLSISFTPLPSSESIYESLCCDTQDWPQNDPQITPTPPFFPTILNCKESTYYWHKAAKTVLESNVRHKPTTTTTQKLPLSYTTAKEKEKSTKFLPIWGNICEDCSELPIYVKNFPQQKHTISSTIDQPVWERLTFLDEKKMLRSRMFGCLTEICARSSWTIIGEIFSAARLCSCNCRDAT